MLFSMILRCLVVVLMYSVVWSFEAPEEKKDVFSSTACPAFLTFTNAAYIAGVTVELPCHCKPEEVQSVVWFFRKHWSSFDETRALTDNHGNKLLDTSQVPHSSDLRSRFSIRMFSLLIFKAGPEDSGLYICGSAHKDFFYGYDLDIQEAPTLSFPPRVSAESRKTRHRSSFVVYSHPMYKVFISFRSWSVCDRCGAPGEQVRIGLCYVHSRFLHVRYRLANQTVASCGSEGVPMSFSRINQGPKVEIRSCQVTCPPEPPPPSKVTALMAFLGYSSASVPVPVPVFYLSHPADGVVTLRCPGARPNMVVGWDQGSTPIYRSENTSSGNFYPRITIDTGHHLVFNPAKSQDSGVYYCWLQGRRAAHIRLLVYVHLGKDLTVWADPNFSASMKTLFTYYAVMTAVFCLMLIGRIGYELIRDSGSWCSAPAGEEVNR
ncbi:Ig-like V-type domain-containing protein FAM187A isoform X1 [Xiphophorus couchianus]|uniref:Ig-like V-type domain-containing protein FAM187A isoform X1 n=1 Tax=Xiphophorus couchianus TaxID=32473 RepID=UPI001016949C|nr:Ig-like V-type domain-containing protein FAM187A isoform X1 [Xiphophorus couchianus]